jgi:outer membrane protein assembly factor BamB
VPRVKRHTKSTHANPTPATDGKHVVAFFGSEGLFAYDMEGQLLWKKDLGVLDSGYFQAPEAQWGFASSPVIHDGRVIVQADVHGPQKGFLAAFDVKDGREFWRVGREDVPTWSTPTVHATPSRTQIVVNGWHHIGGYDLATGKSLWRMRGGGDIPVPTPIVAHDLIFITNAHGGPSPVYAVRTDASGDITPADDATSSAGLAWSIPRNGAYMQTPIVVGEHLFVCRDNGVLTCLDAKTGRQIWQERLGSGSSGFTASAVAADGKIYYTNELGEVFVVRAGPSFEIIATPVLDELTLATPAIVEDMLLFRTRGHVVAIGANLTLAPTSTPTPTAPAPPAPPVTDR